MCRVTEYGGVSAYRIPIAYECSQWIDQVVQYLGNKLLLLPSNLTRVLLHSSIMLAWSLNIAVVIDYGSWNIRQKKKRLVKRLIDFRNCASINLPPINPACVHVQTLASINSDSNDRSRQLYRNQWHRPLTHESMPHAVEITLCSVLLSLSAEVRDRPLTATHRFPNIWSRRLLKSMALCQTKILKAPALTGPGSLGKWWTWVQRMEH